MTAVTLIPGTTPILGAPYLTARKFGFPELGLTNLLTFTGADIATGVTDAITGAVYRTAGAALGGSNSEALLPGGGAKLTGQRYLVGPTVDVRLPYAIMAAITVPKPALGAAQQVLSISDQFTRGFMMNYSAVGTAPKLADPFGLYYSRTLDGTYVADGSGQLPAPFGGQYDRPMFVWISHLGGGLMLLEQRRGSAVSAVQVGWDVTSIQGPVGNKTPIMPILVGGAYPGLVSATGLIVDYLVVWTVVSKSDDEKDKAQRFAADQMRLVRGRA